MYKDALQQADGMNNSLHTVFTRESEFKMNNNRTTESKVKQLMNGQDVKKTKKKQVPGLDV